MPGHLPRLALWPSAGGRLLGGSAALRRRRAAFGPDCHKNTEGHGGDRAGREVRVWVRCYDRGLENFSSAPLSPSAPVPRHSRQRLLLQPSTRPRPRAAALRGCQMIPVSCSILRLILHYQSAAALHKLPVSCLPRPARRARWVVTDSAAAIGHLRSGAEPYDPLAGSGAAPAADAGNRSRLERVPAERAPKRSPLPKRAPESALPLATRSRGASRSAQARPLRPGESGAGRSAGTRARSAARSSEPNPSARGPVHAGGGGSDGGGGI